MSLYDYYEYNYLTTIDDDGTTASSNNEKRFTTFWLWLELIITGLLTCLITAYWYVVKNDNGDEEWRDKKSINGGRVLITNGESELSQEICRELVINHDCFVVLLIRDDGDELKSIPLSSPSIKVIKCNLKNHSDVQQLSVDVGKINLLIDNQQLERIGSTTCDFIENISSNIQEFIQLLINFAPKMKNNNQNGGHFVSIQNGQRNSNSLLQTRGEINEMLDHLTAGIKLSTVFYQNDCGFDEKELSRRIVKGIESRKDVIEIISNHRFDQLFFVKFIKRIFRIIKTAVNKLS